jgi:hypothetical protein
MKQKVPYQSGYLEVLGLVSYEWTNKTLFMVPKMPYLVPTLMKADKSMREFSLTPFSQGEGSEGNRFEKVPLCMETTGRINKQQHIGGEREIGRVKVIDGRNDSLANSSNRV